MITNNDELTAFWISRKKVLSEIVDSVVEERLTCFLTCLTSRGLTVEQRSDAWWELNCSLFREFAFNDEGQVWVILVSRWPFFVTSIAENVDLVTDHSVVAECAINSGFNYIPNTILNEGPPGEQITWRTALFTEC